MGFLLRGGFFINFPHSMIQNNLYYTMLDYTSGHDSLDDVRLLVAASQIVYLPCTEKLYFVI